jgi:hypothetical protein
MEEFVTLIQAEASEIAMGVASAAGSALLILLGLWGLTLMVRAFKLDNIQPATPENYEQDAWNAGMHGPAGPDTSDPADIRNHYEGYGPTGDKIGPADD